MGKRGKKRQKNKATSELLTAASAHICRAELCETGHMRWMCGDITAANERIHLIVMLVV